MIDDETVMQMIRDYLNRYPKDKNDIFTLLYTIGQEEFFKALQGAGGRRIILYHDPEYKDVCDPPIYWRYSKRKSPRC